jgi:hypothetical protein
MMGGAHIPRQLERGAHQPHCVLHAALYFVWFGVVLSVGIHRLVHPLSTVSLAGAAAAATVVCLALNWFFKSKHAARVFYGGMLPLYQWSVAPHSSRFAAWLGGLFCAWHRDSCLGLIDESQRWNRANPSLPEGIYRSEVFEPEDLRKAPPLVVLREHLDSGLWSGERSFAIALLFNTIEIARRDGRWTLSVDLRDQSCAIYSNRGKEFLRSAFVPADPRQYHDCSRETHAFLRGATQETTLTTHIRALRWASGGFLPGTRWRGRWWVSLFFRDIEPVGWNLANGASETKDEYKDLDLLIYRETMEELVICRGIPMPHAQVTHLIPQVPGPRPRRNAPPVPRLVEEHAHLRFHHDNVRFQRSQGPEILAQSTPELVTVTYHGRWRRTQSVTTENVLIAVNPLELGIEVARVGKFILEDSDRLLDGEVHHSEQGSYLVRAPVGLLSLDFLKEAYGRGGGSIGVPVRPSAAPTDDRRSLGVMPSTAFHVFCDDIPLRAARLKYLERHGMSSSREAGRLRKWRSILEPQFLRAQSQNGTMEEDLALLLPVAWKTLEQAFAHGVL